MSRRRTRSIRGYTIAEVLTVSVIMGLVSGFVILIVAPLLNATNAQTAKVDTLQAAEKSFYRMERDLRTSHVTGVYLCTYPAPSTCAPPGTALADAPVLAIITNRSNGNGQVNWDSSQGQPVWKGFQVYWLGPDDQGNTALNYAFADPSTGANPTQASADAAVNIALGATPQFLATSVSDIQVSENVTTDTIGLKMFAHGAEGASTNATSFESDTVMRN